MVIVKIDLWYIPCKASMNWRQKTVRKPVIWEPSTPLCYTEVQIPCRRKWRKMSQKKRRCLSQRTDPNLMSLPSGGHDHNPGRSKSSSLMTWWTMAIIATPQCANHLWVNGLAGECTTLRSRARNFSLVGTITTTGDTAVASLALTMLLTFCPRRGPKCATKWTIEGTPSAPRGTKPSTATPVLLPCQSTGYRAKPWGGSWSCMGTMMTGAPRALLPPLILRKKAISWVSPSRSPGPIDTTTRRTCPALWQACPLLLMVHGLSPKRRKGTRGKTV